MWSYVSLLAIIKINHDNSECISNMALDGLVIVCENYIFSINIYKNLNLREPLNQLDVLLKLCL